MRINVLWDFREAVRNIRALKEEYQGTLTLFSYTSIKEKREYIERQRNNIYALDLKEWQKEKLWEYMNNDIEFKVLISIVNRQKMF